MKGTSVETASYIPMEMKWDTKFDLFMKRLHKEGKEYVEWQKEKYPVKATYKGGKKNEL